MVAAARSRTALRFSLASRAAREGSVTKLLAVVIVQHGFMLIVSVMVAGQTLNSKRSLFLI